MTPRTGRNAAFVMLEVGVVAILGIQPAWGQDQNRSAASPAQTIEEIIVTATKREVPLQDVPIAVSVISGEEIVARGFTQYADYLNNLPGVYFGDAGPAQSVVRIRGMSVVEGGLPTTVATYVGEVPTSVHGSFPNLRLVDIERIEVLRGPQGTLFGANALSGAVRVLPAQADLENFEVTLGARGYTTAHSDGESYHAEGIVNLPLLKERFGLRLVAFKDDIAGYVDNVFPGQAAIDYSALLGAPPGFLVIPAIAAFERRDVNDEDTAGGRISATWQASDRLRLELSYSTQKVTLDSEPQVTPSAGEYVQARGLDVFKRGELGEDVDIGSMNVRYDWDAVSLVSASGWSSVDTRQSLDATPSARALFGGLPIPTAQVQSREGDALTEELRLQSRNPGAWQWLFGVYYLDRKTVLHQVFRDYSCPTCLPTLLAGEDFLFAGQSRVNEKQKAAFGEVSYEFVPHWTAGVGGRFLDDELRLRIPVAGGIAGGGASPPTDVSDSVNELNPSAFVRYEPSDDLTVYLQAARGFRSGFPNQALPSVCQAQAQARGLKAITDPDTAWNYELGVKSTLAGRISINAALYHADWSDIQIPGSLPCGFATVSNAGDATAEGAELEVVAQPSDAWRFNIAASYNDNKFDKVRPETGYIDGERLPLSPKRNLSAGAQYAFPLGASGWSGYARADYQYIGDVRLIFFGLGAAGRQVVTQDAYGTANARLGFARNGLSLEFFGRNVTDKRAVVTTGSPAFGGDQILIRPREIGVEIRYSFR